MRRIIAALAFATAATLVTVAPAQAAPANPVKTLKKQLKPGHGLRVSETVRSFRDGKATTVLRTTGKLEFGKFGVTGADLKIRSESPKGKKDQPPLPRQAVRMISTGGFTYMQGGGLFRDELPEGRKWVRYKGGGPRTNQLIDIFNPKVLKELTAKAEIDKGDYKGTIPLKRLASMQGVKVTNLGNVKVKYLIETNDKGLITRVVSDRTTTYGVPGSNRAIIETRYDAWGAKVEITDPPASQWIDSTEAHDRLSDQAPSEIPDNAMNSLGIGG